jgi:gliding motility-associated-like protein
MSCFKFFLKTKIYCPFLGLFLFCLFYNPLQAQPRRLIANHWYFGNHYGLDFSSGTPVVDNSSSIFSYEAASTMSDKDGNLLFYTNAGGRVDGSAPGGIWNRNHELMDGGDLGYFLGGGYSAAQGALSIKKPGSVDQYYLFTVDELETLNAPNNPFTQGKGLSVFEIDMSANGGLGEVMTSNEKLLTPCFEYLAGTIHGNCEDYWVLTRSGYQFLDNDVFAVDTFYLFLITENGISEPVKTAIPEECAAESIGLIRFSPDGAYFTCGGSLYDFNKNTGEIGDAINLQTTSGIDPYYPIAFSSNGQFLYYFKIYDSNPDPFEDGEIFLKAIQFDLWAPNLFLSAVVFEEIQLPSFGIVGSPQLAPDGKLYIPTHYGVTHGPTKVFVINNPNTKGLNAGFEGPAITISHDENQIFLRFGNFTDDIFYVDTSEVVDFSLGDDIEIPCDEIGNILLEAPLGMDYYLWSDGSTNASISVSEEGNYWVEVIDGCAFGTDTVNVTLVNDIFAVDLGNDTTICGGQSFQLTAFENPQAEYFWQDSSMFPTFEIVETGIYFVDVNIGACSNSDTVFVDFKPLPKIDLGNDTTICFDDELILSIADDSVSQYQWQDGSIESEFTVFGAGVYGVLVANDCGIASDQISVDYEECGRCAIYIPNTFSPNFDGVNDGFRVYADCNFDYFNLKIFSRWGGVLFESNSIEEAWDGTFQNNKNSLGVYVFLLNYEFTTEKGERVSGMKSGDVTILR